MGEYLKRLAEDKVSNLLLAIMFLFDALQFAYGGEGRILFYISLLPLAADIIWCDTQRDDDHKVCCRHPDQRSCICYTIAIV